MFPFNISSKSAIFPPGCNSIISFSTVGSSGLSGVTGVSGTSGLSGVDGISGVLGVGSGVDGVSGILVSGFTVGVEGALGVTVVFPGEGLIVGFSNSYLLSISF